MNTPHSVIYKRLRSAVKERERLIYELAPILGRVGIAHPDRSGENAMRAKRRHELRSTLREVEGRIVKYATEYVNHGEPS